jgi:thermostable 8-oxoguanine DNA glycosylase
MVNPDKITNYNLSKPRLEELLAFWVCVAGKTAKVIARNLDAFFTDAHKELGIKRLQPFRVLGLLGEKKIAQKLKEHGIGCYNAKAKSLYNLATRNLNLRTCTVGDLEEIHGIGSKTSRCFVMHSRPDAKCAGLDVHCLRFMGDLGYDVPKSTPGKKRYREIEAKFLAICDRMERNPPDFDLIVWRIYSKHKHLKRKLVQAVLFLCFDLVDTPKT